MRSTSAVTPRPTRVDSASTSNMRPPYSLTMDRCVITPTPTGTNSKERCCSKNSATACTLFMVASFVATVQMMTELVLTSEFVTTRLVAAAAKFTAPVVLLMVCAPVVPPAVTVFVRITFPPMFAAPLKPTPAPKELTWVNQLKEWQKEIGRDDQEFIQGLKIEFFKNHIFAFTPKGDIIELPEEATPIDFAYAIHSEIGHRATGAKVSGKMVPLDYQIKNAEVIEILTVKDKKKPSRDWLDFVKTSNAKYHIRRELRHHELGTDKR